MRFDSFMVYKFSKIWYLVADVSKDVIIFYIVYLIIKYVYLSLVRHLADMIMKTLL